MNLTKRYSLLLIEDDKDLSSALSSYLAPHGISIHCAETARQAELRLELFVFDLLICDLSLPGLKGTQLLSFLREKYPRIPVVVFTGADVKKSELYNLGVSAVVLKPCSGDEMLKIVLNLLETKKQNIGV